MICDVDWVLVEIHKALRNIEDFLHTVVFVKSHSGIQLRQGGIA